MTVHCVEVVAASDVDQAQVQNKIDDLKSKYREELPDENFQLSEKQLFNKDNFYKARLKVNLSSKETEKNNLTDQIEKEADKSASWWIVRWHECPHDEDKNDCSWSYSNSAGTVPEVVN